MGKKCAKVMNKQFTEKEMKYTHMKNVQPWELPGSLVVRILGFHCRGLGSIPGRGSSRKPHGAAKK